ncbi:unnamed protein product [Gadus morhua 'NCC']
MRATGVNPARAPGADGETQRGHGRGWIGRDKSSCDRNEECGVLKGLESQSRGLLSLVYRAEGGWLGGGGGEGGSRRVDVLPACKQIHLLACWDPLDKSLWRGHTARHALVRHCQAWSFPVSGGGGGGGLGDAGGLLGFEDVWGSECSLFMLTLIFWNIEFFSQARTHTHAGTQVRARAHAQTIFRYYMKFSAMPSPSVPSAHSL